MHFHNGFRLAKVKIHRVLIGELCPIFRIVESGIGIKIDYAVKINGTGAALDAVGELLAIEVQRTDITAQKVKIGHIIQSILAVLVGGRRAWLPEQVDRRLFRQRVFAFLPRQGRNFGRKYGGGIGKQNRRAHRRTQQRLHSLVAFHGCISFFFLKFSDRPAAFLSRSSADRTHAFDSHYRNRISTLQ